MSKKELLKEVMNIIEGGSYVDHNRLKDILIRNEPIVDKLCELAKIYSNIGYRHIESIHGDFKKYMMDDIKNSDILLGGWQLVLADAISNWRKINCKEC